MNSQFLDPAKKLDSFDTRFGTLSPINKKTPGGRNTDGGGIGYIKSKFRKKNDTYQKGPNAIRGDDFLPDFLKNKGKPTA